MIQPVFVTEDEVVAIQADQVARYGGETGLRDIGLLRSAIAQPEASFGGQWLHPDLASMAGAYLFHLVQNHPFVDGNKRVGLMTALYFLALNGEPVRPIDHDALTDLVLGVASGAVAKDQVAAFLRGHLGG
jgi:death-on-curing protein